MDITTNQLNAPVVAEPTAPYGISKYAKSYLDALKSNAEDVVAKANAQAQVVKTYVESEASRLDVARNALKAEAETDRAAIRSELQTAVADEAQARVDAVANLQSSLDTVESEAEADRAAIRSEVQASSTGLDTRLSNLESWKQDNTDEITTEIDKAINAKVDDTLFQSVKTALETADTQFSQDLATAITNRENKDVEHDGLLQRMEKFVNTLLSTYTLVDADGNALTSFDDVVLVPPPQLIFTTGDGVDVYSGDVYSINLENGDYVVTFGDSRENFISKLEYNGVTVTDFTFNVDTTMEALPAVRSGSKLAVFIWPNGNFNPKTTDGYQSTNLATTTLSADWTKL